VISGDANENLENGVHVSYWQQSGANCAMGFPRMEAWRMADFYTCDAGMPCTSDKADMPSTVLVTCPVGLNPRTHFRAARRLGMSPAVLHSCHCMGDTAL
jgi:hypothetical protein